MLGDDRRFQAALFDMDGLLVDSEPLWREVEMRVFGRLGVPLTTEMCLETRGMVLDEVTAYWFGRYPWEGPPLSVVASEIVDGMVGLVPTDLVLKPGARHAVADCRARGLALAVASSSPRRLIEAVVERLALTSWFSVLHSAQEEDAGKPDPAVFLTTARLLGVAPQRCVVFEDSPAGVAGAAAAGMACVAVPEAIGDVSGRPPEGFSSADVILATLDEVDDRLWMRLGTPHSGPAAPLATSGPMAAG